MRRLVVGLSGASGVICGSRLLAVLRGVEAGKTHRVMSFAARQTIILETDHSYASNQRREVPRS